MLRQEKIKHKNALKKKKKKNTGVGCHALLQGIFPTQELNLGLLHCRWILYCLSHQGSPLFSYQDKIILNIP